MLDRVRAALPGVASDRQPAISTDEALDVLANERRRLVIRYAIEDAENETFELDEVVRYIAAFENGVDYTSTQRKAVYVGLYQSHVDSLLAANAIQPVPESAGHTYRACETTQALYDVLDSTEAMLRGGA